MIPSARSMLSRDKRLPLDTLNTSGLQENVFGNQFSTFDSLRNTKRARISSTSNSKADICKKAVDCDFVNARGISAEFYGWTAKTANIGAAIQQIL